MVSKYKERFKCPCCGYPTLDEQGGYDICLICDWEDDGQNDSNADRVLGGPNGEYSLTQARSNFKQFFIMYSPEEDKRTASEDTLEEINTKKELCKVYDKLMINDNESETENIDTEIGNLEEKLYEITREKIKEYEKKTVKND